MSQRTKNARPTAPTAGQAVENGSVCETAQPSTCDSNISGQRRQIGLIADLLLCGAENAVSRRDLMALTGYKDRELRLLIEAERRAGALILSDNQRGYYLAADESEVQRFVKSMRRRAAEIRLTALHVEKAVRENGR